MDITLNTATSGMQTAMTQLDVTANNIANVQTRGYSQITAQQSAMNPSGVQISGLVRTPDPNPAESGTDLTQQMTNMIVDKNTFGANGKVIKVQDQMLGDLVDLIA